MKSLFTVCLPAVLLFCSAVNAQDGNQEKKAYLDAASAGVPFEIQGEYSGTFKIEGQDAKFGVQVIARANNKLAFAAYHGGLPGDGWDGSEVIRGDGSISGDSGTLTSEMGRAEIKGGSLTVYTNENVKLGELAKATRQSPTLGAKPPEGATVLFDGTSADKFENGRMDDEKLLMEGVTSKDKFQDFQLHVEFRLAFMPNALGQARSNSGCYLQGRYEVQILDSFGLTGEDNECGGIYSASKPGVNMCFPPLSWQTYDIEFHAAKFDDSGKKISDAWTTVRHNGVVIHEKRKLPRGTPGGPVGSEGPEAGPVFFQDHGDPLRFRNIWVKPL